VLCLAVLAALAFADTKTGAKLVIDQKGLNYFKNVMLPFVENLVLTTTFPDITGTTGTPIGDIDYSVQRLKLSSLSIDTSNIALTPPKSIVVSAANIAAEATMAWGYYGHIWPHVRDNGTAVAKISKTSATLVFVLGADATGHPTLATSGCGLTLGTVDIKLSGGASWLYQIFVNILVPLLKGTIQSTICTQLPAAIDAMANEQLSTLPVMEPIGFGLGIDYMLPTAPVVGQFGLSLSTRGEMYAVNEGPGHTPGSPVALPDGEIADAEIELVLSEWTLASVAYSAWHAGLLSKLLTQNDVPPAAAQFFTTSTYSAYAPGLVKKYGAKQPVALALAVKAAPVVLAATKGFTVDAEVLLAILGKNPASGAYEEAFEMLLDVDAEGTLSCRGDNITGELDVLDANTTLVETFVGEVDVSGFSDLVTFVLSMAEDLVNSFLVTGFPIPSFDGVSVKSPAVKWGPRYVLISGDVKYVPPTAVLKAMQVAYFAAARK